MVISEYFFKKKTEIEMFNNCSNINKTNNHTANRRPSKRPRDVKYRSWDGDKTVIVITQTHPLWIIGLHDFRQKFFCITWNH